MKRRWGVVVGLGVAGAACGELPVRPEFGPERVLSDHREVDVSFVSDDATLAGTLYLPSRRGRVAVVAVNPGSAWTTRAPWEEVAFFVEGMRVGVFSYDRRGEGQSTGACCPVDDQRYFDQLARDLGAAAAAMRRSPLVDPKRTGVFGSSLGGWVVPLAANLRPDDIAFTVVTVGGAVSSGQEAVYDRLTGYDTCTPSGLPLSAVTDSLRTLGPSGFDPHESLERLTQPGIWIYGGRDFSHPADLSVENLARANPGGTKDWTTVVLPNANHDLIEGGSICQAEGPRADVLTPLRDWFERRFP